jgi:hypothetical protein
MRVRLWVPLVLVSAVLALVPASAGAATVFGADLSNTPDGTSNDLSFTNVIKPGGAPDTGAPVSGVLVSVRIKTRGTGGDGVIRVLGQTSHPDTLTYVFRNTPPEIPVSVLGDLSAEGHVTQVLTRRPIAAGQRLGMQFPDDNSGDIFDTYSDLTGECAFTFDDHLVGFNLTYTSDLCNHNLAMLSGTIEADADGDGFGDGTQDQCPTNGTTQGSCPLTPATTTPAPGASTPKKQCKKKHKKRSASAAKKKKCKKKRR